MQNCTIAHISIFYPRAPSYFLPSYSLAKSKLSKEIIFFPDRDLQMFADYFVECPLAKENSAEGAILSDISSEKVSQYLSSHKFCICYFPVSKFDLLTCAQQTSLEPPHPGNKNRSSNKNNMSLNEFMMEYNSMKDRMLFLEEGMKKISRYNSERR